MSTENISEIVIKAKNGDNNAFSTLYELTQEKAYYTALKITKNPNDAQDMLQDAYVKAFTSLDSLNEPAKFVSWFNCIVANTCRNYLVKKKPNLFSEYDNEEEGLSFEDSLENEDKTLLPEAVVDNIETRKLVLQCIENLPEDQKMCVIMYYYDEMSVNDIAGSLNLSSGTVKSRLSLARKKLKKSFEELERKGTKLYGSAVVPLILWALLYDSGKKKFRPRFSSLRRKVMLDLETKGVLSGLTGGGTILGVTTTNLIIGVVATVVAVTAIVGGVAAIINSGNDDDKIPVDASTSVTEGFSGDTTDNTPDEIEIYFFNGDYAVTDSQNRLYYLTNDAVVMESNNEPEEIFSGKAYNIVCVEDAVYFVSGDTLYMYQNGETASLFKLDSRFIYYFDSKLYGINQSKTKAYEINADEKTELPMLISGNNIRFEEDALFYRDSNQNIYRVKLVSPENSQMIVKYNNDYGISLPYQLLDGEVYYTDFDSDENGNIYHKSVNAFSAQKINVGTGITDFCVTDYSIYFADYNGNLYRYDRSDHDSYLVAEGNYGYSCFTGGYLLWYNANNNTTYVFNDASSNNVKALNGCATDAQLIGGRLFYQVSGTVYSVEFGG